MGILNWAFSGGGRGYAEACVKVGQTSNLEDTMNNKLILESVRCIVS